MTRWLDDLALRWLRERGRLTAADRGWLVKTARELDQAPRWRDPTVDKGLDAAEVVGLTDTRLRQLTAKLRELATR